jgi:hypothetical protein
MDRALEMLLAFAGLYLFLSVIGLAIVEWIASVFDMRAQHLKRGFIALLQGKADAVLDHPLVKSLGRASGRKGDLPSYVPREIFSTAVLDVADEADKAPSVQALRPSALDKLLELSGDPATFKSRIETWFDAGMERVSGQYKRSIQVVTRVVVAVLVVGLNADSVEMGRQLWREPAARAAAVAYSERLVDLCEMEAGGKLVCPGVAESGERVAAAYPIGWSTASLGDLDNAASILAKLIGLLATFLAASLGAPFWFDVLRKVAPGLRQSGAKPDERPPSPTPGPDLASRKSA